MRQNRRRPVFRPDPYQSAPYTRNDKSQCRWTHDSDASAALAVGCPVDLRPPVPRRTRADSLARVAAIRCPVAPVIALDTGDLPYLHEIGSDRPRAIASIPYPLHCPLAGIAHGLAARAQPIRGRTCPDRIRADRTNHDPIHLSDRDPGRLVYAPDPRCGLCRDQEATTLAPVPARPALTRNCGAQAALGLIQFSRGPESMLYVGLTYTHFESDIGT